MAATVSASDTSEQLNDLLNDDIVRDPYPSFKRLRDFDPLYWNPRWRGWVVTGYQVSKDILRNTASFSSEKIDNRQKMVATKAARAQLEDYPSLRIIQTWVSFVDSPAHERLRRQFGPAFTVRAIESMTPFISEVARRLVDELPSGEPCDFLHELAFRYPMEVITHFLGIPLADSEQFKAWSDDLMLIILGAAGTEDRYERASRGIEAMSSYLAEQLDRRRADQGGDDFLSMLVDLQRRGGEISNEEMIGTAMIMLFGGHETSTNLLANALIGLDRNPTQQDLLRRSPQLVASAVEEFLRYDGPTKGVIRWTTKDTTIEGKTLAAGDRLLVLIAAANRDPLEFEVPDELLIERKANSHLGFGTGAHVCLGAPLARREMVVALPMILERFDRFSVERDSLVWKPTMLSRSLEHMTVRFG